MYETGSRKIDELIPYANNSRTHSDRQIEQIASSIAEFGFTNPVLIDEKNGIIAGHGRFTAAKKLNLDEVPVIILDGLTDAQKKAYVIADNKLALNAGWDDELLKLEIETLQELDFNVDLLGWDVLPNFGDDIDYSILDDNSVAGDLEDMADGVKRAIQIEFESGDYEEAQDLIKQLREIDTYIGGLVLTSLRDSLS